MPRVPNYDNFQVSPTALPAARVEAPRTPGAGAIQAEQAGQLGQALSQGGAMASRIVTDQVERANEVRVTDAVNRAKEQLFDLTYGPQSGYVNLKGDAALRRPENRNLADEYVEKFQGALADIERDLGNDAQRQAFRQAGEAMRLQIYGDAQRHVAQEFRTHRISIYDGTASTSARQIALNYNDVREGGLVDQGVRTLEAAVREKARLLGLSQTFADAEVRRAVSGAHRMALGTALERNDPAFAEGYLKKYADQMEADDILHVRGAITKEMQLRQAVGAAAEAVKELAPSMQPSDFDRMVGITVQSESGGRRYGPDGKTLLTSPKGAKGEMQVLDGTNRDPGFGVPPARDDSPAERARVGRDYLQAMLRRYGGDPAKAWAAYNAGPGAVDNALKMAEARPGANWLVLLPSETRAYVEKNLTALQNGLGRPAEPTLAQVHERVRVRLAGPDVPPQVVALAVQEATRQWETLDKSRRQEQDNALAEAQRLLIASGGDLTALPPALRNQVDPGKVSGLMDFAGKLAAGQKIQTDWQLYYDLSSNPDLLQRTNLAALRPHLADEEFKQLTGRQAQLAKGDPEHLTRIQSAGEILKGFMRQAGIDPNGKGKSDIETAGRLTALYAQRVEARERASGKKLTDTELRQEAAQLFQPVKVAGLLWDSDKPAALVEPTDRVVVPSADRKLIADALRRAGRPVTDEAVADLYRARNRLPQRSVN
ncbi:MAG: transglycosylase SLT domain-containing protein [Aquabacterium sp.]|nr:transglycosylase SLT domain-containing protein [Aquabacterium sp.]